MVSVVVVVVGVGTKTGLLSEDAVESDACGPGAGVVVNVGSSRNFSMNF